MKEKIVVLEKGDYYLSEREEKDILFSKQQKCAYCSAYKCRWSCGAYRYSGKSAVDKKVSSIFPSLDRRGDVRLQGSFLEKLFQAESLQQPGQKNMRMCHLQRILVSEWKSGIGRI